MLEVCVPVFSATPNILVMADLLENAEEIHVMDNCVFHMTEQLNPKGRLFLHQYVRARVPIILSDNCSSKLPAYHAAGYQTYRDLRHQWTEVW
jgi:hypothetical protein